MNEFGENGRHLQATKGQTRRLRSAFDVFDFVTNAVDSGVRKAKQTTEKALKEVAKIDRAAMKELDKAVEAVAQSEDSKKVIEQAKEIGQDIKKVAEGVKNILDKKDK